MGRLTEKRRGKWVIPLRLDGKHQWFLYSAGMGDASAKYLYGEYADRLAAYEDTGLEPEEVVKMGMMFEDSKRYSRRLEGKLKAYEKAKEDGRLVVLPCKVGDTVYRVITTGDCPPVLSETKIGTVGQAADLIGKIGKHKLLSYYLTREEAEAALGGRPT